MGRVRDQGDGGGIVESDMSVDFGCSCEMVFGEVPPPAAADEAYAQPCIRDCPTGRQDSKKCVKLQ